MKQTRPIVSLALKAIALAMAVACVVMGVLKASTLDMYVVLLAVGLFALAFAAIIDYGKQG